MTSQQLHLNLAMNQQLQLSLVTSQLTQLAGEMTVMAGEGAEGAEVCSFPVLIACLKYRC